MVTTKGCEMKGCLAEIVLCFSVCSVNKDRVGQEPSDDVFPSILRGKMERGVSVVVADERGGSELLDQEFDEIQMTLRSSQVKGSFSLEAPLVWIKTAPVDQDHQSFLFTDLLEGLCDLMRMRRSGSEEKKERKKKKNKQCGGRSCRESQKWERDRDREGL